MSGIKYTIAAGDDDEHYTRFPCLAMVRYAMAGAVTLLAIAVIALVIHAVLRSEDVRLSVNNGFIGADNLWGRTAVLSSQTNLRAGSSGNENQATSSSINKVEEDDPTISPNIGSSSADPGDDLPIGVASGQSEHAPTILPNIGSSSNGGGLPKECSLGCRPAAEVTLKKAKATNLRVILIAKNPGGRTKIDCNHTTVRLLDVQAPHGVIGELELGNFTVPAQTTITMQKPLSANASYIWDNYPGEVRFSVKVQVNASVTSFPLGKTHTVAQSYTCQPVTVGLMGDEWIYATDQVDCRAS